MGSFTEVQGLVLRFERDYELVFLEVVLGWGVF